MSRPHRTARTWSGLGLGLGLGLELSLTRTARTASSSCCAGGGPKAASMIVPLSSTLKRAIIPLYFAMVACMMRKHFAHSSSTLGVWWCTLPMRMKRTDATRKSA
eukprot:scaffold43737_cov43-Phaeocystis_antarctica.AAC.1